MNSPRKKMFVQFLVRCVIRGTGSFDRIRDDMRKVYVYQELEKQDRLDLVGDWTPDVVPNKDEG